MNDKVFLVNGGRAGYAAAQEFGSQMTQSPEMNLLVVFFGSMYRIHL